MTGEPQEPDNQLITLENDPIYYEGITPEELLEGIDNSEQPRPRTAFFNKICNLSRKRLSKYIYSKVFLRRNPYRN